MATPEVLEHIRSAMLNFFNTGQDFEYFVVEDYYFCLSKRNDCWFCRELKFPDMEYTMISDLSFDLSIETEIREMFYEIAKAHYRLVTIYQIDLLDLDKWSKLVVDGISYFYRMNGIPVEII